MKLTNALLLQLKKEYGTPLYIYDEHIIINNINIFKENFKSEVFKTEIIYAGKAFLVKYMAQLINQYDLSLDCVSTGELYTAIKADFNLDKVVLHGNNKTLEELKYALNNKVGTIILDNLYEASLLLNIDNLDYKPKVFLRVNLAFDVNTHKYIKTSIEDSKFGVSINDQTINMIKQLINHKTINFVGLHSHIGSQILDEEYFYDHAKLMMKIYFDLKENHQIHLTHLNLGGGFGIKYTKKDKTLNLKVILNNMIKIIEEESIKYNLKLDKVYLEPGRSIVGDAGYTLYTINQIKQTSHLNYLFIDGSMNDNLRTSLYQAEYDGFIVGKENDFATTTYKVAGKACESGDIIIDQIKLPEAKENDLFVVKSTGAYHYSMASNYNRLPVPPVIFVNDKKIKLIVKGQTLDDLIKYDVD